MNELRVFNNPEFGSVRTVQTDEGSLFVGKDVTDALGYTNSRDALLKRVLPEDKQTSQIATLGQRRRMTIINESGLYSLVLSSKLPTARKFQHWVTSEVLPSIRKTGSYNPNNVLSRVLAENQKIISQQTDLLMILTETLNQIRSESMNNMSVQECAEILGKTEQFVRVGLQTNRLPFGSAVKINKRWSYHISREALNAYLSGSTQMVKG